jgi:hypothetical protein
MENTRSRLTTFITILEDIQIELEASQALLDSKELKEIIRILNNMKEIPQVKNDTTVDSNFIATCFISAISLLPNLIQHPHNVRLIEFCELHLTNLTNVDLPPFIKEKLRKDKPDTSLDFPHKPPSPKGG